MKNLFNAVIRVKRYMPLCLLCLTGATSLVFGLTPNPTLSLKNEPRPEPPDLLSKYATDKQALIALGKAFFWDMQVGSDGIQACASCHFHAGADNRKKNQLSPGLLRAFPDTTPDPHTTFTPGNGPNHSLAAVDFPLRKLKDPLNRNSTLLQMSHDVVSSQGIALKSFIATATSCSETTTYFSDTLFSIAGINIRRVEPRNTPTMINAVFNHRNFWNGRAQAIFNGVNQRGEHDTGAHVYKTPANPNEPPVATVVQIEQSSLASQAVSPPSSNFEMSAEGRPFLQIGKKMINCRPLAKQLVHPNDSVLGGLSTYNTPGPTGQPTPGINKTNYSQMIREAFRPEWWSSNHKILVNSDGSEQVVGPETIGQNVFSLEEYNFSLFFGLAIQAYEAALVSDDTPWDRYNVCATGDTACQDVALTADQRAGADLFFSTKTRCGNCHRGSALTDASVSQIIGFVKTDSGKITTNPKPLGLTRFRTLETYSKDSNGALVVKQRQHQLTDTGFNNIGVTSTLEDLGIGSKFDPGVTNSTELSVARRTCLSATGCKFPPSPGSCFTAPPVLSVDGAMKIPGLRNVALTAPYFHNGGTRTLDDVLDFYSRGGDFSPTPIWSADRTTSESLFPLVALRGPNFDITSDPVCTPNITKATEPLTHQEKTKLLMFLGSLTDERVRLRKAPFDHPQLFVPNGHPGNSKTVIDDGTGYATDNLLEIPATGQDGGTPLPNFL